VRRPLAYLDLGRSQGDPREHGPLGLQGTAFQPIPDRVGLILISYVLGWPMVGLFSFLAAYFQRPGLLICGPLFYGFSTGVPGRHVLAGRESLRYVEIFSLWSLRMLVERLTGQDAAKDLGADSA